MQVMRQKIAAGFLAAHLEGHFRHIPVAHGAFQLMQRAQPGNVGDGFDVENKGRIHDSVINILKE